MAREIIVLLRQLKESGLEVEDRNGKLLVRGPRAAITEEIRQSLKRHKEALRRHLRLAGIPDELPRLVPSSREGAFPLSFAQRRWWVLEHLTGNPGINQLPAAWRLKGDFNPDVFSRALRAAVERHEVLRTKFELVQDEPMQRVLPSAVLDIESICLDHVQPAEREQVMIGRLRGLADTRLHLDRAPLVKAALIRLGEEDHVFFVMPHHIVWDGWSWDILLSELTVLYRAFSRNAPSPLAPLPVQYGDFVQWQNALSRCGEFARQLRYWREFLAKPLPKLEIPTDFPRPALMEYAGRSEEISVPGDSLNAMVRLGKEERASLQMVLMASIVTILHRLGGQDDLIVGIPIQARSRPELEGLIGVFVNTLVLRFRIRPETTFRELIRQVREVSLGAFDNQDVPFDRLVEEIKPEWDTSRTPIYQALFSYQDVRNRSSVFGHLDVSQIHVENSIAPTDLTFGFMHYTDGLRGVIYYRERLFAPGSILRMDGYLRAVIASAVTRPDQRISELGLLSPEDRNLVVREWNRTECGYPCDLLVHELFEEQCLRTPDRVAVASEGVEVTYRELNTRAEVLAGRLRGAGVGPETLVGICVDRSIDMVVGLLGILKAGGAYVPIDPAYPAERIAFILEDAGAPVLLTQSDFEAELPRGDRRTVLLGDRAESTVVATPGKAVTTPDGLAYVIFTSGSTGKPKGVQITHRAAVNFLTSMAKSPGIVEDDVLLAVTTLSFDIALLEWMLPLTVGAKVVIASRQVAADANALRSEIDRCRCTILQATPVTWKMLLEVGWEGWTGLKALCGGEPMSRELANALVTRCGSVWNMYGPTETTVWSTLSRVERGQDVVSIGKPIHNTQIYIVSPSLQVQPIGVPGELLIGGDGVARGYWKRPELTAERFIPNPFVDDPAARLYRTGDLARWRPDGTIECLGRTDHQVKIRGFRIELGEIESALKRHARVSEAVVVAREDREGERRLVGYVIPRDDGVLEPSELRQHLRSMLPDYMVPSSLMSVSEFPLTPNGKIDRRSLPPPTEGSLARAGYAAPQSETERRMVALWQEVLGVDRVGLDDSFFDLGGHSLLAVTLFSRIEKLFSRRLPLATLFRFPTVSGVIGQLGREQGLNHRWSPLVCIQKGDLGRHPLFCVHGAGGNVLLYRDLASHMGSDIPLYGIQSVGLDGVSRPHETIEAMAAHYLIEILQVQPEGPYMLAGYCMGGAVAYEMARLMQARGIAVDLVALLDTYNFSIMRKPKDWKERLSLRTQHLRFHFSNFVKARGHGRVQYLREKLRAAREVWFGSDPSSSGPNGGSRSRAEDTKRVHDSVRQANDRAAFCFRPLPFQGDVTVFKPEKNYTSFPDPKMGWGELVSGRLEIVELPVNPHAMLVAPYVGCLADELRLRIDQICSPSGKLAPR